MKKLILAFLLLAIPQYVGAALLTWEDFQPLPPPTLFEQVQTIGLFMIVGSVFIVVLIDASLFLFRAFKRRGVLGENIYSLYLLFSIFLFICSEKFIDFRLICPVPEYKETIQSLILLALSLIFLFVAFIVSVLALRKSIKTQKKPKKGIALSTVRFIVTLVICLTVLDSILGLGLGLDLGLKGDHYFALFY
ncbi:MAG: hypothetical protein KAR24_03570 [Candidatus Pacebacteria bacterium]|nr:hypothetical protein [Candidatus Paceibacterota bacterium]